MRRYHVRPDWQAVKAHAIVVDSVEQLAGHVLVLAGGASPASLLAAIAPLRSRLLRQLVPVVVLSSAYPFGEAPGRLGVRCWCWCWCTAAMCWRCTAACAAPLCRDILPVRCCL